MTSTSYIDFSVRQNKSIERSIVFDALRQIKAMVDRSDFAYIGFGSVWFVDFEAAHREIGVETMISIEADDVVYERALFNRPYRTVEVLKGHSRDVFPDEIEPRSDLKNRPWIVWLDYDEVIDETKLDEISHLIQYAPDDSIILTTFSASAGRYAKPAELHDRFEGLLGDAFPLEDFPSIRSFRDEGRLMVALSSAMNTFMQSEYIRLARPGKFVPSFCLQYQDGTPMATAGGVLASDRSASNVRRLVTSREWKALSSIPIVVPPLTPREVSALRTLLPASVSPSREQIRSLGFDLLDDQIGSFVEHYLRYPIYFQAAH